MKFYIAVFLFVWTLTACSANKKAPLTVVVSVPGPAGDSTSEPYLFTDPAGAVYMSWIQKNKSTATLWFSRYAEKRWFEPIAIASGDNWFINWADYPVIASDGKGNLLAHFLQKSDTAKFTYDVKILASNDSGKTWSKPVSLHDDGIRAEHGFVSMAPYGDNFAVSWLDGRNAAAQEGHAGHHGQMTVRAAILNKKGEKLSDTELDNRVCDCCQTRLTVADSGPVIVYRDRSESEIRDMSVVRYVNNEWTAPQTLFPDNWKIEGCPVNGPAVDAVENAIGVAWFTMPGNTPAVRFMFSDDGGQSFGDPIRIDEGEPIGRVDVVLTDASTAVVCWMEGSDIKAVTVHKDGTREPAVLIASSSAARSAGFPQMTKSGEDLLFAWTDDVSKKIKMATLSRSHKE